MSARTSILKLSNTWHKRLAWLAFAAIVIWGVSGVMHPFMSWTGPKAQKFYAPKLNLQAQDIAALPGIFAQNPLPPAQVLKLMPSAQGPVLQWTRDQQSAREYYDLTSGAILPDYDQQQAVWLAGYYTGLDKALISSVSLQTTFNAEYPWVNRLLPVYRIAYNSDDQRVVFIHTETAALASITNTYRTNMQTIFRALHTWNWLDATGYARVILLALFMLCLFCMAIAGIGLLLSLKWRSIPDAKRRWHRIAAYALWLPLLGWSASGFYHLLQAEYVDDVGGMRLDAPLNLQAGQLGEDGSWIAEYANSHLNAVSLVQNEQGELLYRLGIAPAKSDEAISREQRFAGAPKEAGAIYVYAASGLRAGLSDRERSIALANKYTGYDASQIADIALITRFGPGYDFRNKRLPVWRVAYKDDVAKHVFVDPVTGILVDQNRRIDRAESLSFSLLHKWNHLNAVMSRQSRDVLIVITLLISLAFSTLGALMLLNKKRRIRQTIFADDADLVTSES